MHLTTVLIFHLQLMKLTTVMLSMHGLKYVSRFSNINVKHLFVLLITSYCLLNSYDVILVHFGLYNPRAQMSNPEFQEEICMHGMYGDAIYNSMQL